MEAVGEGVMALDDRVETAMGEGVAALDARVDRARASVETALNELVRRGGGGRIHFLHAFVI